MKDYHGQYLKCNVLLLANVFEKISNTIWKNCGIDIRKYLITPTLSWDVIIIVAKFVLELILDPEMYILFEKSARGRVLLYL